MAEILPPLCNVTQGCYAIARRATRRESALPRTPVWQQCWFDFCKNDNVQTPCTARKAELSLYNCCTPTWIITATVLNVLWIDRAYSWCLAYLDLIHGFIDINDRRREGINGGIWRGCLCFRYQSIKGGDYVDPLSKVLKCSCHLAATDSLSDSSFPSSAFNRADEVAHFCFSCRNEAKASLISPYRRWFSFVLATCFIHCCLSCLSDLLIGAARRLYSSTFPLQIACLHWSIIARVAWDIYGFLAHKRFPRTSLVAKSRVIL